MMFLSRTQVITALGAVLMALYVLDLVRRRKLSEEYSLLWVMATTVIAVLGFSTPLLTWITHVLGFLGESSTTFAFGLVTRYDLEKLSALELRAPAVRRLRDALVGAADRLARVFEPRRTT